MECITWPLAKIINSLGLLFDIVGVVLLFCYGLPPEGVSRTGAQLLSVGISQEAQEKAKRYVRFSWAALIFLVLGFVLQIVSNFLY